MPEEKKVLSQVISGLFVKELKKKENDDDRSH